MTKQDKKERRAVRHALQKVVLENHFSLLTRLNSTPAQLRAYSRVVADQLLAGKNPALVEVLP